MSISAIVIWLILAAGFLVVELITVAMVSVWFLAGALAALAAALLGAALWLQIVVFLVVSALCFWLLYPRLKHLVTRGRQATNADMVIGKTCRVTQRIDNIASTGAVSVGGKTWSARSENGEPIEEGALVTARSIQGVKLIVAPAKQTLSV